MACRFVPAAAQSPPQPRKIPAVAAVSVTGVGSSNSSPHVPVVQLMVPGLDMTLPVAPGLRVTVTSSWCCGMNVAVHDFGASIVTFVGFAIPLQSTPLQPLKTEPVLGAAVNIATEPWSNVAMQVGPQLILGGVEKTDPLPLPMRETVNVCSICVKVAVQPLAEFIVTMACRFVPAPAHAPPQPPNVEFISGVAVSMTVTGGTGGYTALHVPGQLIPPMIPGTSEVTVPDPVPVSVTASVLGGITSNVAIQLRVPFMVTLPSTQSAPPLHPANVEPPAELGMRVTIVPSPYDSVQSAPQLIPAGLVVTVPEPLPVFDTVRTKVTIGLRSNVAVQRRFPFIVTLPSLQSAAPLQPTNVDPESSPFLVETLDGS